MASIFEIIATPFGYILSLFYNLTDNYIIALILLTIAVKLLLLPITITQKKTEIRKNKLNAEINKLKEKYADDKEKLQTEIENIKKSENNVKKNIGCITSILQFIILIAVFNVVCKPLTFLLSISADKIEAIQTVLTTAGEAASRNEHMAEIDLLNKIHNYKDALLTDGILTEAEFNKIIDFNDKFSFMGADFALMPQFNEIDHQWIIPLLVLTVGCITATYQLVKRKKANPGTGKFTVIDSIGYLPSLMSFFFSFMFPAGIGFYWAISNLTSFIQNRILSTIYSPKNQPPTSKEN